MYGGRSTIYDKMYGSTSTFSWLPWLPLWSMGRQHSWRGAVWRLLIW
jgi:hypothetical protein